jgi:4-hydroxybenzoate polyprenyltransferase
VTSSTSGAARDVRTDVQKAALAVGAVFLLVGVLGFIPGITSDYGDMSFAGHESTAKLLGLFQVSVLHNIVHLLFGAAGIALARQARTAYLYLVGGGVIYLVLWLYGLIVDKNSGGNFVPVNNADNWLHLLLGLGMIAAGVLLSRRSAAAAAAGRTAGY